MIQMAAPPCGIFPLPETPHLGPIENRLDAAAHAVCSLGLSLPDWFQNF
jgi:hypothetical protein